MTDSTIDPTDLQRESAITRRRAATTDAAPARTLLDVFAATASRCANRTALDASSVRLTYSELWDAARALADRLQEIGVGPGDRVGVRVPSGTAELYIAILGTLHAGAAYVPIDAEDPPERTEMILDGASACALIEDGLSLTVRSPAGGAGHSLDISDDAWIIFTSGSTGTPKGVAVTHRAAAAFVDAEASLWAISPEDRVLAGLSVAFDASCEEMWLAWRNGAALVPAPRELVRAGAELGRWLAERAVSVISTVPSLAAMWDEADLSGVQLLILGGEACPEPLAWRLGSGRELWNTYGPTEATVVSTATRLHPGEPVTIGWPLRGWEVAIVDETGLPVALGEAGELVIGGVGLGRYLDADLDASRYAALPALGWDRAYRTGDVVRETIDGLEFIGRRDDQVKLGGRRIELGEVEARLSSVPGVRAAAAVVHTTEAGNPVLVGYVVGDVDSAEVRAAAAQWLPQGVAPMIVRLDSLPTARSGKVDRKALPWPPPSHPDPSDAPARQLGSTARWLAERWAEQLGARSFCAESDFFELGGSSLAAAKLVSVLRERFPAVAVSDVYNHRSLGALARRLDAIGSVETVTAPVLAPRWRLWGFLQALSVLALLASEVPEWALAILALDRLTGIGPQVSWLWLIGAWAILQSLPARALLLLLARRVLLKGIVPGRYPRHGWAFWRLSLLKRLEGRGWMQGVAGTPWAARYARLCGHTVGAGARLHTLPPLAALMSVGENATIEPDVDLDGWWVQGSELVIGEIRIGPGARIGTHALLQPGATIGAGAEVEPGSVIAGTVPTGERWAGSPAQRVSSAGESWPKRTTPGRAPRRAWGLLYAGGLSLRTLLPLIAALPDLLLAHVLEPGRWSAGTPLSTLILLAPLFAAGFVLSEMLVVAAAVRLVSRLIKPGWHPEFGATAWALWLSESLMAKSRQVLFPIFASVYTRRWLRMLGIPVGKRTEISTAVGLNPLTRFGEASFAADLATCAGVRHRDGWLHVSPIEIGDGSFIGNGAMLNAGTTVGDGSLIGVLTTAPESSADGTSWLGAPALELPRRPAASDPSRTVAPPRRRIVARGAVELVRILLPTTFSIVLGTLVFSVLDWITTAFGLAAMLLAVVPVLATAGIVAMLFTVMLKWAIMGRYRPGEHPLWSFFVWRDEIINSAQEMIAGQWLLNLALGTPIVTAYLRLMGSKVGRDVWCDALTIVEFDAVELGDGCALNRASVVQTHLYHDRVLRIGRARIGSGSTLGPDSHVLPETVVGAACTVGWRSVVMWGEELPPGTSWHGSPVVAA